ASDVVNRIYMFKDPNTGTVGANLNLTESDLYDSTTNHSVPSTANGWYVTMHAGEKLVNGPIVVAAEMIFGTNQPCASGHLDSSTGDCAAVIGTQSCDSGLGLARRYDINYLTGGPGTLYLDANGNPVSAAEAP